MIDLAPAERAQVAVVDGKVADVLQRAQAIEVQTSEDARHATEFLAQIVTAKRDSEKARKFLVDPLNAHVNAINARFKGLSEPLDEADGLVRGKVLAYQREQEKLARAEQERLDAARRAEETRIEEERRAAVASAQEAARGTEGAPEAARSAEEALQREVAAKSAPVTTVVAQPLGSESASVAVRKEWKGHVIDEALVPREYLVVDQKKINAAVKGGVREIPGVLIEQVDGLQVRAR